MTIKELKEHIDSLHIEMVAKRDHAEAIFDQLSERTDEIEGWLMDLDDYEDAAEALEDTVSTLKGVLETLS